MTFNEVYGEFVKLSAAEKVRFLEAGRKTLSFENSNLIFGAKVQFKLKDGRYIPAVFVRSKRKNAEVKSMYNRYGLKSSVPVTWTVSPSLLIPLTAEQAKLHEFP